MDLKLWEHLQIVKSKGRNVAISTSNGFFEGQTKNKATHSSIINFLYINDRFIKMPK